MCSNVDDTRLPVFYKKKFKTVIYWNNLDPYVCLRYKQKSDRGLL
jgi:hypothetical protein